ncbi:Os01g0694050 [Oryza sativa Japonica Group]|uniref:Os01g0694050 protein n=1 Tax=Oryza sativa subsp. japonica TaxID=39947 RepID=A0A0N7KDK0_ORYSJ|nr:Os01g0694050 [Oryza sativa Japonica Group]
MEGMVPDRLLYERTRVCSRGSLSSSVGTGPMRVVLLSTRLERKERLPICGLMVPSSAMSSNSSPVTHFPLLSHETPIHEQKGALAVQLLARMPLGSLTCSLKSSSAARSVLLYGGVSEVAHGANRMRSTMLMQRRAMVVKE